MAQIEIELLEHGDVLLSTAGRFRDGGSWSNMVMSTFKIP